MSAGMVVQLRGSGRRDAGTGVFPVKIVQGDGSLVLEKLYDELPFGNESRGFVVRTYAAQIGAVSELLRGLAGIVAGEASSARAKVINPEGLRRACVLGTLYSVYAVMAAATGEGDLGVRGELYEKLFGKAVRAARVEVDFEGEGRAVVRQLVTAGA